MCCVTEPLSDHSQLLIRLNAANNSILCIRKRQIWIFMFNYSAFPDFESFGKPTNSDKVDQIFNWISTPYFVLHLALTSSNILLPVFQARECKEENLKRGIDEICGMVARMWLPFDYDFFPVKQILIVYQRVPAELHLNVSTVSAISKAVKNGEVLKSLPQKHHKTKKVTKMRILSTSAIRDVIYLVPYIVSLLVFQSAGIISFAMFESVQHMCGRFRHLSDTFVDVLRIGDPTERRKQFGKAVRYHYRLIELANMMNDCYGPCYILHLVLTAPVLGITGYRLVTTAAVDAGILFFGWIVATAIVCTAGQALQDSSVILSDTIYETEWYDLEKDLQRDLILVILRSRSPIYLTAGPFGNMTYTLMVAILKAGYSYLTLLQQKISA